MIKDPTTLARIIQSYVRTTQLTRGRQLHAQLICSGGIPSTFVANHLLHMYGRCGDLDNAVFLFERIPQRNLITWTFMISGYTTNGMFRAALRTFSSMWNAGVKPSEFTFSNAIRASVSMGSIECGKQMHALSTKLGLSFELFVGSNLADLYSKSGSLVDACQIFEEMPAKDVVSWTAMIDGYVKNGKFEEALLSFRKMLRQGVHIDQHAICSIVIACGRMKVGSQGKTLHSCILKSGFESEILVANALTDMYSKAGDMNSALCMFGNGSQGRNVISGSSLIDGYVEMDRIDQAFNTFVELRRCEIEPNEFTFSSMIKACAGQAALEQGTQIHAQLINTGIAEDLVVSSLLVDMYGKCGLLNSSIKVFEEMHCPPAVAWNCLISVLARHGCGWEAIKVFDQMVYRGIKPSDVTFVNLLMACSHSGLVEEGLGYFDSMHEAYGIESLEEHYSCIIDLLSRAGRLQEAEEFISRMPFEPNAFGWCSLIRACKSQGDMRRAELAAEHLMRLEPDNSATHVLLSDVYATAGQWEDVKAVRKLMRHIKTKKLPGYSWVDANRKTHVFGAEDWCHPLKREIYVKLEELSKQIREAGYVADTTSVSSNVEVSTKELILNHHSERIAVAFALISIPATNPIIVKKNLRVCVDCHSAIKLISKVVGREIIVRDITRFHHFANGFCSCGDFW